MPKKLNLQQIIDFIEENDTKRECTLLSTEYKNSSTPLLFMCNKCGKTFERDWNHLKRGRFSCQSCSHKVESNITIQTVKDFILENDKNNECTLLSTVYKNSSTPLSFCCNICGKEFQRDYEHLVRGKGRFRCPTCGISIGAKTLKYSEADVDKELGKKEYLRIGPYKNAQTPFLATCKRGHQFTISFSNYLAGHSGCKQCAIIDNSGENSPLWKGGESEVIDKLRKSLKDWKFSVMKRDNFLCQITKEHDDLVVHHIDSFNTIIKKASSESGIPIYRKVKDYDSLLDFEKLKNKVLELHTLNIGITLTRKIHNDFHKKYGKGNNTREQFNDYLTVSTYSYRR